ncbi:MAG: hypothetical protein LBP42_03805, partial [Treponema sp.]|nr:hypothetical protein [Treponema sp.]
MKSSNPFYAVLAVYIPFSVLVTLLPLADLLLPPSFSLPLGALFTGAVICALAASIFHALMYNVRNGYTAANIRGIIIILALSYTLVSVCDFTQPWGMRFFPSLTKVLFPLVVLYVWLSVIFLKGVLGAREIFEAYTRQYQGTDLQRTLLEDADFMSTADRRFAKTLRIYTFQLFLSGALTVTAAALGIPLPFPLFAVLIAVFINAVFIFALFGLFRQEHYFAGEGIALAAADRSKRLLSMLLFPLAAALGALIFVSKKSILPFSWITRFLSWLLSLLDRPALPPHTAPMLPEIPEAVEDLPMEGLKLLLDTLEPAEPWPFWDWLKYGAIALGALAFLWFMVKPLFDRDRFDPEGLSFRKRLLRLILRWFRGLRAGAALFWASLFGGARGIKTGQVKAADIRRLAEDLLSAYSPAKKREMRRSVTLFARLILWGTQAYQ